MTAEQLSLDIADFSTQLLQPAMQSFAQKIDTYLLGLYKDVSNTCGVAGTTPNDIGAITGARKILYETKTPFDMVQKERERRFAISAGKNTDRTSILLHTDLAES